MPPASLEAYESGGAALLPAFTFGNGTVPSGLTSDVLPFEIWNSKGDDTADTANGVTVFFLERAVGTEAFGQSGLHSTGRFIEMRAVGVEGEASPYVSAWTQVGAGRPFRLPPIPADSARLLEARDVVPGGLSDFQTEFLLTMKWDSPVTPLAGGLYEAGGQGIVAGIGDGLATYLAEGGTLTPSGSPDDEVTLSDTSYVHQGVPRVLLEQQVVIDGDALDGALIAGEAYWNTLSVGAAGTVTETKSNAGTAPLSVALRPAVPAGEVLLGYVHRDFDAAIAGGDIYQDERAYGLFRIAFAGLTATLSPGVALVDGAEVRYETERTISLPASEADVRLFIPRGEPALTADGTKPDARALEIYRLTTGAASVTATTDNRKLIGRKVVRFRFAASLVVAQQEEAMLPVDHEVGLSPLAPVVVALDDAGAGTGGRTAFEVEFWNGAAWVSLFTSSGTEDRRPAVANGSLTSEAAIPEVRTFGRFTRLRARVIEVPSGGAAPAGAELLLSYQD